LVIAAMAVQHLHFASGVDVVAERLILGSHRKPAAQDQRIWSDPFDLQQGQ
jgi:hypothetical protein